MAAVVADEAVTGFVSDTDEVEIQYDLPESLTAPVASGTVVGAEKIYLNGVLYARREISLAGSAQLCDLTWCLRWVVRQFFEFF